MQTGHPKRALLQEFFIITITIIIVIFITVNL